MPGLSHALAMTMDELMPAKKKPIENHWIVICQSRACGPRHANVVGGET